MEYPFVMKLGLLINKYIILLIYNLVKFVVGNSIGPYSATRIIIIILFKLIVY